MSSGALSSSLSLWPLKLFIFSGCRSLIKSFSSHFSEIHVKARSKFHLDISSYFFLKHFKPGLCARVTEFVVREYMGCWRRGVRLTEVKRQLSYPTCTVSLSKSTLSILWL